MAFASVVCKREEQAPGTHRGPTDQDWATNTKWLEEINPSILP